MWEPASPPMILKCLVLSSWDPKLQVQSGTHSYLTKLGEQSGLKEL